MGGMCIAITIGNHSYIAVAAGQMKTVNQNKASEGIFDSWRDAAVSF